MQVWEQVKVSDAESEHVGKAGVVEKVEGDSVTVKLDDVGPVVFKETQLQRL